MDKWDKRFMDLADNIASWSSCCRRQVGAIIVKDKRIIATGYNGAPAGVQTCVEKKSCIRNELNIPSGTQAQICYAVHAEQNAVSQAARMGVSVKDATIYVTHQPCVLCSKILINAGIKRIVYKYGYPDEFSLELLKEAGIQLDNYQDLGSDEDL
jgi:dCMP deaminase